MPETIEYALAIGLLAEDMQKDYKILSDECRKDGCTWMQNKLTRWKSRNVMQIRLTKQMLLDSQCKGILLTTGYKSISGVQLENDIYIKYKFE